MKRNRVFRLLASLTMVVLFMTTFSVTAFAGGGDGDYYTGEPVETTPEPTEEPATGGMEPTGVPLTPEGNATLVDDYYGDKQLITVTTKAGNYFYILIDRANEDKETAVHFLNQVDEADLMALMEDGKTEKKPAVCTCGEKCQTGAVNTACPVCAVNMSECAGKAPVVEPEPEPEKKSGGGGWLISWCIGHLVGLADAAAYDDRYKKWRYEDLPILPAPFRYVVSEEKAAQFHILRSLMERPDVTELVNACDAGREGELIFRLVYEAAGCSKPFSRLWISSMEDAAIREGFSNLHPGADYDPLYQSALCRQKADWLIGINASRLFSVLYHRTLNVGRVQTPTLAMLADRDSKIVLFRKEKYHHVRLALEGAEAVSDRIVSPEDAQAIRDACDGQRAVCVSLVREKKTEKPPKLYDLTTF